MSANWEQEATDVHVELTIYLNRDMGMIGVIIAPLHC